MNEDKIVIRYRAFAWIPGECEFSFLHSEDDEIFFSFLVNERYFSKSRYRLTPLRAIRNYLIGLTAIICATIFIYFHAIEIANKTALKATDYKAMIFDYLVGHIGEKGIVCIGITLCIYLLYKIFLRYKNPPEIIKLFPPRP